MRVLVTRPLVDARFTAQELARLGHAAVVAPLFLIRYLDGPELVTAGIQAILATSGNGVRALARRSRRRDVPLFAVGSHTAALAREAGFAVVSDAGGDSAALARAVCRDLSPDAGAVLHVGGKHTVADWQAAVAAAGFDLRTSVAYEAVASGALPASASEALVSRSLDAVLLFSPRGARVFSECVRRAGLAETCGSVAACCISDAVARALGDLHLRSICVASRPDHDRLLALLESDLP